MVKKPCTQLTAEDFQKYPVWEYLYEEYDRKAGATLSVNVCLDIY